MSAMTTTSSTRLGRDVRAHIPDRDDAPGFIELSDDDREVWRLALPHLGVRNNDRHTLYAYGMARAILAVLPGARAEIVLPAILLHDVGWSTVAEELVLEAIAPGGGRHDLVRQHETAGAAIAREVLTSLGRPAEVVDAVAAIIDGHDTRSAATSLEDAIVKDADKLWRITPDGLDVVRGWFALDADEALRIVCARVHAKLLTDPGRAIGRALAAIAALDLSPERAGIGLLSDPTRVP